MKPNILLITVDSLRADVVGEKLTPFLHKLARSSYVYPKAIAPGIPTFFCFPAVFTGRLPFTYGYTLGIPNGVVTFPQVLRQHGYLTAAFIGDNPNLYSFYHYNLGFSHYVDGFTPGVGRFLNWSKFLWNMRSRIPEELLDGIEYISAFRKIFNPSTLTLPGMKLNKLVRSFLTRKGKEPFFCWVHYMDVHLPYATGVSKYFFRDAPNLKRVWQTYQLLAELPISIRKLRTRNSAVNALLRAAYDSCVRSADDCIRDLVTWVKTKYPNTVVIITSDHGEEFMEHGHFQHEPFSLYDELIRVPLLIDLPTNRHEVVTRPASLVSLAKTISELARVKNHAFVGSNLLERRASALDSVSRTLLGCRSPQVRLRILDTQTPIEGYREIWSYRGPRYKYIVDDRWEREQLYDLELDTGERTNQINGVNRGIISEIAALHSIMDSLQRRTHDAREIGNSPQR